MEARTDLSTTQANGKPDLVAAVLEYVIDDTFDPWDDILSATPQRERHALPDGILRIRTIDKTLDYNVFKHGDVEIIAQHEGHVPEGMTGYCLAIDGEQVESVTLADLIQIRDSLNTLLDCPAVIGALA